MTHRDIVSQAFKWFLAAGCKTYGKAPSELAAMVGSYAELLGDIGYSPRKFLRRWL